MAKVVRKLFGEGFPERVHVLNTHADFNHEGLAEVEDEVAAVFNVLQGYELVEPEATNTEDPGNSENSDNTEDSDSTENSDNTEYSDDNENLEDEENSDNTEDAQKPVTPKRLKKAAPGRK